MTLQPCSPQQPQETIPEYAARVLRYLLQCETTILLTDDQLTQADHAAQRQICSLRGDDGTASHLEPHQRTQLQILTAARHSILSLQEWRRRHPEQPQNGHAQAASGPQETSGGKAARLQPPTPSVPPAPAYALPQPAPTAARRRF